MRLFETYFTSFSAACKALADFAAFTARLKSYPDTIHGFFNKFLWLFRLQLDYFPIHNELAVSVMVEGLGILLCRIGPGLEDLQDE